MERIKLIEQEFSGYCVPTALAMAVAQHGVDRHPNIIAERIKTSKEDGSPSRKLVTKYIRSEGLIAIEQNWLDWERLKMVRESTPWPILTYFNDDRDGEADGHAVLIEKVKEDELVIADPGDGKRHTLSREYWMDHWWADDNDGRAMRYILVIGRNEKGKKN